ncbi:MAG TPA: RagB/SusD family nutrient uptake outer membrane protein [Balneolaceae bacterium]|nr:RagB/SusD family nutrient uptake outer membrane protein [Balneolaceae bacterium]
MVGIILFASCTNLSENPYSEITSKNFNPTQKDVTSLVGPVYTPLRYGIMGFQEWMNAQEQSADEVVIPVRPNGWYDGGRYWRMHRHTWTATDGTPNSVWNFSFDGINAANRVLYQISSGQVPVKNGKDQLVAELKTARAFYYSILLNNFGNVPIVTDFSSDKVPEQSSRKEVYNFVVKQLQDNIPNLSEVADQSTYGRFNKWAGKAVLADVYLNAGVYTGTTEWQKVIDVTQDIIDSGKYQLTSDYKANFTRTNQNSSEIIFAVPYDEINGQGNMYHMSSITPQQQTEYHMTTQPWGGASSQPQFIDTYDSTDHRLEDTWIKGPQYDDQGNELIDLVKNVPSIQQTEFKNGYRIGKYQIYNGITVHSDVDFPFYRYAGVLMMKAEALLRTGQADAAAQIVTKVRMRDFDNPADATVTGAELQQGSDYTFGWWNPDGTISNPQSGSDIKYGRMLDELGWEFADEGHRRTDLIRFGVFSSRTWLNHKPQGDYTQLYPIPQNALNTNSNLQQNPGY